MSIYIIFILLNVVFVSFNNLTNIDYDNDANNNTIYFYDIKRNVNKYLFYN